MWWNSEENQEEKQTIVDIIHQEQSTEEMKEDAKKWLATMPDIDSDE